MAKMVDMKRSKAEQKAQQEGPKALGGDEYSYEHRISLDHNHMKKLGIKEMPKPGDVLHLQAHAHVASSNESSEEGGEPRRHISLQLKKMAIQATKRAESEQDIHEGHLRGAKAAMDKALDEQERGKRRSGSTGAPGHSEAGDEGEED